jgi:hypothetical protein
LSKSVWVAGRELKFCITILCKLTNIYGYSNLEFFEIRLGVFLKNSEIFLKNGQKFVLVGRKNSDICSKNAKNWSKSIFFWELKNKISNDKLCKIVFKTLFSWNFESSRWIFLKMENAYSLVCNVWKVHTRPTSASDFLTIFSSSLSKKIQFPVFL